MRTCRKCGNTYPLNKENFGHQPNGNYRYTCRACVRANVSRHHYEDPYKSQDRSEQRRDSIFTAAERQRYEAFLGHRDGHHCFYCKTVKSSYHIDHKVPMSRGGEHSRDNFALACMQCNQEKHNKTIDEYRIWLVDRGEEVNF